MQSLTLGAAAAIGLAALVVAAPAAAATQTLFETTYRIPPSAQPGQGGSGAFMSDPLVITSRGTLTASISPATFGAAIDSLSFNVSSSSNANLLSYVGSAAGGWMGEVVLDPGTYYGVVVASTRPNPTTTTPSGFFGMRLQFAALDATVVPIPAAGVLLASALAGGLLFGRRRRAQPDVGANAIRV
jgi:hypothetical protein